MIITITGKNDFLAQQRLRQLVSDFTKDQSDLALEPIDAAEASLEGILDAVASVPFLASRKMVVIRDLSNNKLATDNVEHIISSTSPTTDLVIVERHPDKRTAYFKELKKFTQLEEYVDMDTGSITKWLVNEAKKMDASLSNYDANYLVDRVGIDQMQLNSELQKLATYDANITRESIELLSEKTPQSKIFDLLDATFSGNRKLALELYEEQRAQKVEPQAILALLAWQLNLIALAKYGAGKTSAQIASDAKLNPYPVQKAQKLSSKITHAKLTDMVNNALDIDYRSKTSSIDLDEALKTYIVGL